MPRSQPGHIGRETVFSIGFELPVLEMDGTADMCGCKVGQAIDDYGLKGMNEDLVARWTGQTSESVRQLADRLNRTILATALEDAGRNALDQEVETTYRLLVDDETSSGSQVTKRRQLEREGMDVDTVLDSFVSHQTMYRHLTSCLDESAPPQRTQPPAESAIDRLDGLVNRTDAVLSDRIERLASGGDLDHDEYRILVDVSVTCDRCGEVYSFADLVDRGGCGCETE